MSNTPKGRNIPWILIVLSFVFGVWPLGVVLIVLRLGLDRANSSSNVNTRQNDTTRSGSSAANGAWTGAWNTTWNNAAPVHHYTNDRTRQNQAANPQNTAIPQMTNAPAAEPQKTAQTPPAPVYTAGRGASAAQAAAAAAAARAAETAEKKNGRRKKKSVTTLRIVAVVLAILGTLVGMDAVSSAVASGMDAGVWSSIFTSLYMLAGGGVSWGVSNLLRNRDRENARYLALIGNRDSMSLTKISAATSYKIARVRRDLQRMIDDGLFGDEAYIDMSNLCFMRTPDAKPDGIAEQYDDAYRRTMSHVGADLGAKLGAEATEESGELSDFDAVLRRIRQLDDDIQDEAVSERIRGIETITARIFEYVGDKPEKKKQIRTFMSYYLPTTLKLLESYQRIERVGVAGQNMQEAKENIEKILDVLTVGFQQQMDQLFREESLDISSDIEVLEQMMQKDGLTGHSDFDIPDELLNSFSDDISDELGEGLGGSAAQNAPRTGNQ